MSCNGCRVLRKGCSETCVIRHCLAGIDGAEPQGHATLFLAKFFGRAGLMGFIAGVEETQRPALFQSLLFEACGRTINPVFGAAGLLWTGQWHLCEAAVDAVLRGGSIKPTSDASSPAAATLATNPPPCSQLPPLTPRPVAPPCAVPAPTVMAPAGPAMMVGSSAAPSAFPSSVFPGAAPFFPSAMSVLRPRGGLPVTATVLPALPGAGSVSPPLFGGFAANYAPQHLMQQQQQQQQQYMQLQHQQQLQQQLQQQQQQQQQMAHLHSLYSPQSLYPPTATVSLPATAAATMSAGQPMVAPSQMLPYWPAAHVSAGPTSAFPSTAPGGVMMIATPPPPAQLTGMSMGGLQPMAFGQVAVGSVQSQQLQGNPGQAVAAQPTSAAQKQQQQLQQQQQQQQQLQKQQQADSERQQRLRPCTPPAVPAAMDSAKALAAAPGGARVAPERTESPASCLSPMYSAVSGARLSGLSGSKSFRGPEDSSTLLLAPVARRPKLLHAPTSASPQFVSPNLQVRPDLAVGSCSVPGARAGSESLESHATVEAPELGAPASFPTPSAAGSPYLSLCSHGSQAGKLHEQQSSMLYSVHQSAHSQQSSPGALLQLLS